jgi:ATP-dependent RNA helicase DOB1
LQQVGRKNKEL